MKTFKLKDSENVLPDDYPLYVGYVYIVDNIFSRSDSQTTVGEYKAQTGAKEIRRCELFARPDARLGDRVE